MHVLKYKIHLLLLTENLFHLLYASEVFWPDAEMLWANNKLTFNGSSLPTGKCNIYRQASVTFYITSSSKLESSFRHLPAVIGN